MAITPNQGLVLPDGTDNANVPLSMTDYNTNLENRLVQRYLSVADRTARNALPFEGELSYLGDLDRYEFYTGTAWTTLLPAYSQTYNVAGVVTGAVAFTTVGGPVIGVSVIAPSSGVLKANFSAYLDNTTAGQQTIMSPQLNTGSVVGAGAVVTTADDNRAIRNTGNGAIQVENFRYFTGLTPGNAYNVFLLHRVTGGSGTIAARAVDMIQG